MMNIALWEESKPLLSESLPPKHLHNKILYNETLNNEYIERIHQMSYSSLSDNGMLPIFSFLIQWLYGTL